MSGTEISFQSRVNYAHRYFDFLAKSVGMSWIDKLGLVESSTNYGLPEVLVLIQPKHYAELKIPDPRGPTSFGSRTAHASCRSKEIWGYGCPFTEVEIHTDHLFPYSRGGLTHYMNAMHLCSFHNTLKFTDIHLIPWEKMVADRAWIENVLIRLVNGAKRLTKENLYLPTKQLSKLN